LCVVSSANANNISYLSIKAGRFLFYKTDEETPSAFYGVAKIEQDIGLR
jgi:hypothetical protein